MDITADDITANDIAADGQYRRYITADGHYRRWTIPPMDITATDITADGHYRRPIDFFDYFFFGNRLFSPRDVILPLLTLPLMDTTSVGFFFIFIKFFLVQNVFLRHDTPYCFGLLCFSIHNRNNKHQNGLLCFTLIYFLRF